MRRSIGKAILALAALAASAIAFGGTSTGTFGVRIVLSSGSLPSSTVGGAPGTGPGTCISESLSERTGALVRVVCATGQFVSIGPRTGRQFFGTHGGAYGYHIRPAYGLLLPEDSASAGGGATVTSYRVYSIDEAGGPLHMLVSF